MSRKTKPSTPDKHRRKQELRERQRSLNLIMDTAACFTCPTEIAQDFAHQSADEIEGVEADLAYNRVAHEMWRDSRNHGQQIAEALADYVLERERHMHALAELNQRFVALARQEPRHAHLAPIEKYQEIVRSRIFPELSPLA